MESQELQNRYNYFLSEIATKSELWTLIDNNGNFALFEVNNTTVFSVWPDEASIESNLSVDWKDYIPFRVILNEFEELVIPIIRQNNYFINVFPVNSRTGHIVTLIDFVRNLNIAIHGNTD